MFRPRQRDENAYSRRGTTIQKPERRDVIDPNDVQSCFPHLREIAFHLITRAEVMPFRVRFKWPVGDAFNEEFSVAFEEKFRDSANRARGSGAHSGSSIVQAAQRRKDFNCRSSRVGYLQECRRYACRYRSLKRSRERLFLQAQRSRDGIDSLLCRCRGSRAGGNLAVFAGSCSLALGCSYARSADHYEIPPSVWPIVRPSYQSQPAKGWRACRYRSFKLSRMTRAVVSKSAAPCATETKPLSNCEGAK